MWVELATPQCRITARIRPALGLDLEVAANEWRVREPKPFQRRVRLQVPLGKRLEPFASEAGIAGELLAKRGVRLAFGEAQSRGRVAVSDDRVELSIPTAGLSSRTVKLGVRAAIALARALNEARAELPRADHEQAVRTAWADAAAARGGHFDPASERLTFDSSTGGVEARVTRDKSSPAREWRSTVVLTFERSLSLPADSEPAREIVADLEQLVDEVELDTRQLRAWIDEPVRDREQLERILEALVTAAIELDARFVRARGAYR